MPEEACYSGEDLLGFDSSIAKLKEAFSSLLPEIFQRGQQQQFTIIKEAFPRIRSSNQTNPNLLAQARITDLDTLDKLKDARQALDFLHECFENSQIIRERATRDEQTAFTAYDLLFSQIVSVRKFCCIILTG